MNRYKESEDFNMNNTGASIHDINSYKNYEKLVEFEAKFEKEAFFTMIHSYVVVAVSSSLKRIVMFGMSTAENIIFLEKEVLLNNFHFLTTRGSWFRCFLRRLF